MKFNSFFTRLVMFLLAVAIVGFGVYAWWRDSISPVDATNSKPITFVVAKGEGMRSIATRLNEQDLIKSPTGFYILVKLLGIERNIQAGEYRLTQTMDGATIARELTHGIVDIWVTTLEGWRSEEVASKIAKELDIPEAEFLKYAKEGYMFPDTYLLPKDATAAAVVATFTDELNKKLTDDFRAAIAGSGMNLHEILTMASIVEREGRTDEDRPVIAGILLKRLKAGWPLQADATLQYALGYQPSEKTWWKKELTEADKTINSPYNTYKNTGLPPGPIANPGLSSIRAVLYPTETDYWYYLHDTEGVARYAATQEEHDANVARYLR